MKNSRFPLFFPLMLDTVSPITHRESEKALAMVALGLGSLLAWLVITQLFEFDWLPDWGEIFAVLGMGLAVVMGFALGGSLPLLRAKPAQALRAL